MATDSSSNLTSFNVSGLHGPWDATSNRRRPSCSGLPSHSRQLGKTTGPVARTFGGGVWGEDGNMQDQGGVTVDMVDTLSCGKTWNFP